MKKLTWEQAVVEAKKLLRNIRTNKLLIAEIALQVCDLRGVNQNSILEGPSLREFSRQLKINHATLGNWIGAYRKFREKNPKKSPTISDFKEAAKSFADRPKEERKSAFTPILQIPVRNFDSLLSRVESSRKIVNSGHDLSAVPLGTRKELIIKLREVANALERTLVTSKAVAS